MVDMAIPGSIMASAESILVRLTLKSVHPPYGFYYLVASGIIAIQLEMVVLMAFFVVISPYLMVPVVPPIPPLPPLPMSHSHTGCITGVLPATAMCLHWGDPWGSAHAAGEQGRKEEEEAEDPLRPWDEAIWPRRRCVLIANSTAFCTCVNQSVWMSSSVSSPHTSHPSSHFMSHASGGDYKLLLLSIMCVHSVLRNFYTMIVWIHIKYQQLILASKEIVCYLKWDLVSILWCSKNCATKQHSM